ncbi:substrate-binding domain-containing protein [Thermasporomyces composti]|uniref:von Willebrand factor type A domain-containing protein n=1 Tax=Thermasporomyces composti TaxID=696763 RepID=A0A3D9VBM6_THECX|nr:substrate-binding domain-containing protein [Thermasporomyces composti]REF34691.1 von Willebrand factor type A domain-containing protein [Thermasporomyces composti]
MPGRHAAEVPPRSRRRRVILALVLLVALVVPAAVYARDRGFSLQALMEPEPCSGEVRIEVAAAPEIVEPLRAVTERMAKERVPVDGRCVMFDITAATPREIFTRLSSEAGDVPDLWIPDTWEWVSRTGIPHDRLLSLSPSVAATPLVLATTQAKAEELRDVKDWPTLATAGRMALADAERSGPALSALLAIRRSITDDAEAARRRLGTIILQLIKERVDSLEVELDQARRDGLRRGVPATEQQVVAFRKEHPTADVVPVVPSGGTVLLEYPLVSVLHQKSNRGRIIEAGAALMRYVDAPAGRAAFRKAGFRDYRDQTPPDAAGAVGEVTVLPPVSLDDADDVLRSWAAMSLDTRLLTVVDVSGSMAVAAGDRSRIELARDAAKTALTYFPDKSQVGLWEFAENRDGRRPWRELSAIKPLTAEHRAELNKNLDALPRRTGGGTGLYDTFLAAYRVAQNSYDPTHVNSLVLLTDSCSGAARPSPACANEDTPGISLNQLINTLQLEADPARPIAVILVGIGPQADIAALERIAKVTSGRAYRAKDPQDMESIIIDSLLRRQCGAACE